jgi:undecaprenyl diphosphate synthase
VVTIYAFSIENFKRSKHEVDALMSMAKVKLQQLAEHGALLDRYGASVRVLGQRELISPDVLMAVDKAVAMTANNKKYVTWCFMKRIADDRDQSCSQRLLSLHVTARNHDRSHEDCRDVQHADTQPAYTF